MNENEEFEFRARLEAEQGGKKYDKAKFAKGPLKIGKDALADDLREELRNADWFTRNLAGVGSAVVNAAEGVKGLVGRQNNDTIAQQKIIAEEAPIGNIVGNVAMLAPTAAIPGANTVAGASAIGAVTGALTTPSDATTVEGLKERALSGVLGGAGGAVGAKVASKMAQRTPAAVDAGVQKLIDEKVRLTPGQNAGGWAKSVEDKLTSVPFLGEVINNARREGLQDFNKAVLSRATLPGESVEGVGRDSIQAIRQRLGSAYDDVLAQSRADMLDPQFVDRVANLRAMVQELPKNERKMFDSILDREIGQRMAKNGMISGENLQSAKSKIGLEAENFKSAQDGFQRKLGDALAEVESEFMDLVSRTNPQNAEQLKQINKAYANFKRIQRAASSLGAEDGVFTPAQLANAVKAMDKSKDKRAFSEGGALLQDIAEAGKSVMPNKVPDSGTAARLMNNLFSLNGLMSSIGGIAAAAPAYVAYSRPGSAVINKAVNASIPAKNALARLVAENPDLARRFGISSGLASAELVGN